MITRYDDGTCRNDSRRRGDCLLMGVYSFLLLLVLVVGAPYWLVRMATSGRYRAGLPGRLGRVPEELRAAVAGRDVVWVHAVSVGEVVAAARLVGELREALPGWVGGGFYDYGDWAAAGEGEAGWFRRDRIAGVLSPPGFSGGGAAVSGGSAAEAGGDDGE